MRANTGSSLDRLWFMRIKMIGLDWFTRIQNNVSGWSDRSTRGCLFQRDSTIKVQLGVFVLYKADIIIITSNLACSRHDIVVKQESLTKFNFNK